MRPRIALLAASLDILGGQGIQARALVDRLTGDGYDITFIPINPRFPAALQWLRRITGLRTLLNEALYVTSLWRLRRADVVHIFSASYWSFLLAPVPAILAARALGKHVVLHYHSGEADDHLAHWGALVHPWLRLVHDIVVPSKYLQDVFARHGYRCLVIRNVIDTAQFTYRERYPLRPRLLSARNLERHYGVDTILRAFALVKEQYPDATLTVAGYGSEDSTLRRLAAALRVTGIGFVGRVEPPEMPALYDQADVFVNASVIDNQPVSVLEAFAAGLPVISTPTGDIPDMACDRGDRTGAAIIIRSHTPAELATAFVALLEDPLDQLAMVRRARARVGDYTWPVVSRAWAAVYHEAIAKSAIGRPLLVDAGLDRE